MNVLDDGDDRFVFTKRSEDIQEDVAHRRLVRTTSSFCDGNARGIPDAGRVPVAEHRYRPRYPRVYAYDGSHDAPRYVCHRYEASVQA